VPRCSQTGGAVIADAGEHRHEEAFDRSPVARGRARAPGRRAMDLSSIAGAPIQPTEPNMTAIHAHKFAAADWPFAEEQNVAAMTTVHVLDGSLPILVVAHDAEDGMWQILCGTTNDPEDGCVVCLGCVFDRDPSIGELADLALGWYAWREAPGQPWHRKARKDR
jgi:hypothetical protein